MVVEEVTKEGLQEIVDFLKEQGVGIIETYLREDSCNANLITFPGDKDEGVSILNLCREQGFPVLNLEQIWHYVDDYGWAKPYFCLYFS